MKKHVARLLATVLLAAVFLTVLSSLAAASTASADGYTVWKSILGITTAKHYSTTTFSYDGTSLLSSPKAVVQSWWCNLGTSVTASSAKWDWYTTGKSGTCRGDLAVTFTFGVPTKWGPIGANYRDVHLTTGRYNGTWTNAYM